MRKPFDQQLDELIKMGAMYEEANIVDDYFDQITHGRSNLPIFIVNRWGNSMNET